MSIETNAFTDLEKAISISVCEAARKNKFPESRIDLLIEFKDVMRVHSDTIIKIEERSSIEDPVVGEARIIFNSLFLSQDPSIFFDSVVPHELSHLFNELTASKNLVKVKKHGQEWQDWMFRISASPDLDTTIESELFDNRAAISRGGGCIAACKCDDPEYLAFGLRSEDYRQLVEGELFCHSCDSKYEAISPTAVRGKLSDDIQYLHVISGLRPYSPIERVIEAFKKD